MPDDADGSGVPSPGTTASFVLLAELTQAFAASRCIHVTLAAALERITRQLRAESGAIFILDQPATTLTCVASRGPVSLTGLTLPLDKGIVGRSVRTRRGTVVADVSSDPDFFPQIDDATGFHTRSLLCSPIVVHDQCLGAIELANGPADQPSFCAHDLRVLDSLAAATGLAILGARATERLVREERIARELELAAEIQKSMLPRSPSPDAFAHGVNVPARIVSGDFYDLVPLEDGRLGFNIGDVAGKGFRSAMLMAKTASLYRCLLRSVRPPGPLLRLINRELYETRTAGLFVTMIAGVYDPASGLVRLGNAGHLPALIRRCDGTVEPVPATTPPLGALPDFEETTAEIERSVRLDGGVLYLFTDGITESRSDAGEMLDIDGLAKLLSATADRSLAAQLRLILDRLVAASGELGDDATLVAIDDRGNARTREAGGRGGGTGGGGRVGAPALRAPPFVPEGELLAEVEVAAQADRLRLLRQVVSEAADLCGFGPEPTAEIVLAVDEASQNVVRHAYPEQLEAARVRRLVLQIYRCTDRFVVRLRDFGDPVDVGKVRPRPLDDLRAGGLGTHLMREIMDEVAFEPPPADGGNILRMVKRIPPG